MNESGPHPRPILRGASLAKSYALSTREVRALRGVSLSVCEGESVCIMGASGAGKSTLLNILGGLDRPSEGRVLYREQDLYRLSAGRRNAIRATELGFIFQSYQLLPELTVLENTVLPAMGRPGYWRRSVEMRERARSLLQRVGLAERLEHRPTELSGGEQQRVAIARSLMNQPRVIFADEPTGNLDSVTGHHVLEVLFALTREIGQTLVMVTHNADIAGMCGRILHLRDGQVTDWE